MIDRQPLAGLRVLVVEDEYFIAADLKDILRRHGAESVHLSGSIDDAFDQLFKNRFDFVTLDLNIRGETIFPFADRLFETQLLFAFISGYDRKAIPARFDRIPNWGKPYDDQVVVGGIEGLWAPAARPSAAPARPAAGF